MMGCSNQRSGQVHGARLVHHMWLVDVYLQSHLPHLPRLPHSMPALHALHPRNNYAEIEECESPMVMPKAKLHCSPCMAQALATTVYYSRSLVNKPNYRRTVL